MSDAKKPRATKDGTAPENDADGVPADDAHKTEKLTKAGRDELDPDDGSE